MVSLEDFISDFDREKSCVYNGRRYFVRDNGAVYRLCKDDGTTRPGDEVWTIGKPNSQTGYLFVGKDAVHRIVCTAFRGEPVGDKIIADHIDMNTWDNRLKANSMRVTCMENRR